MSDLGAEHNDGFSTWWQRQQAERELTKLECGLLGALSASIVLAFLFWVGLKLSIVALGTQLVN